MLSKIKSVKGYELLDSRGNPTVAALVELESGAKGFAISPSGASTGSFEAHELRDGNNLRFAGKGVTRAVNNIDCLIEKAIKGVSALEQKRIDELMLQLDGTENKSRLGANAILAVSLATAHAASCYLGLPLYKYIGGIQGTTLPRPMLNILNGGAHAKNNIDIQEFMIVPLGFENFKEGLRASAEVYHTLGKTLERYGTTGVGDEGGFAPDLSGDNQAIEIICEAVEKSGYTEGDFKIALDIASTEWEDKGKYFLPKRKKEMSSDDLIAYYEKLVKDYPIISIEDALGENDWQGWQKLTEKIGNKVQLVGDDLFVTNPERLEIGIKKKVANSILVKPNQIGSLSETIEVVKMAQKNNYATIISHRSGESEDTTIADIAVALNAGQIKTGAPCRSDRNAKYNRLLMIEQQMN